MFRPTWSGVRITHPDRVMYPDSGLSKVDLARYYERIAEWIVPHVQGRPLTLVRCPTGLAAGLTARVTPDAFTVKTVPAKLARLRRDPWADYWTCRQRLRPAMTKAFPVAVLTGGMTRGRSIEIGQTCYGRTSSTTCLMRSRRQVYVTCTRPSRAWIIAGYEYSPGLSSSITAGVQLRPSAEIAICSWRRLSRRRVVDQQEAPVGQAHAVDACAGVRQRRPPHGRPRASGVV